MATVDNEAIEASYFIRQETKKISDEMHFFFIQKLTARVGRVKVPEAFNEKKKEAGIINCISASVIRTHTLNFLGGMVNTLLDCTVGKETQKPLLKEIKDNIKQVWQEATGEEF